MIINGLKQTLKLRLFVINSFTQKQSILHKQHRTFSTKFQEEIDKQVKEQESFFLPQKQKEETQSIQRIKQIQIFDPKNHDDSVLIEEEENKIPLSVRERQQTIKVYQIFKEKNQWGEFYRVFGILLCLLGGYFLVVPFYEVVCQTFGFSLRKHSKSYKFADDKINVFKKFRVSFMAHTQDDLPWEFQPQTSTLVVNAGETSLAFYKVYNRSDKPIAGIAIYQVYPDEVSIYFNKIQCFCFENQLLYPKESVDLPILFYLDPAINHDAQIDSQDIMLTYHFFPSADQSIAEVLQKEIEKHEQEQKQLAQKRQQLKERGIQLDEMQKGVLAPGHNPKESTDMYVQKIMKNQKRMNNTIAKYEEEQKQLKLKSDVA